MPAATRINRRVLRRALIVVAVIATSAAAALAVASPASASGSVPTTTTLSLSNTSVPLNQPVTMTATVTAAIGALSPTGTVTFQSVATDGTTTTIGSVSVISSGVGSSQAAMTSSSLPGGSYQIVAKYSGALLTYSASTSAPVQLTVAGAVLHNTVTTLTADRAVITAGDNATFTANVSESDGVLVPTGTVTFTSVVGGVQSLLGQADLDGSGTAQLTIGGWQAGAYTILAQYVGDRFDKGSSAQLVFGVNSGGTQQLTTTTTVALSPSAIQTNGTVDITATVNQSRTGAIPPAGDHVNFYATASGSSQAVFLGQGDVTWTADGSSPASGTASLSVSGWQAGQYTISADFIGDIYDAASAGHAVLGVTAQAPTTLPYTGDTSTISGTPATVSFQLLDASSNPVAAEPVAITINGHDYPGVTDSSGNVAVIVSLPVGAYPITAAFTGDRSYLASAGNGTLTISPIPTSLVYTGDTSVTAGSSATIGFILQDQNGNVLPNESVAVTLDGQTQTLTSDASGNVSFVVTKPRGTYPISASFGGDGTYLASAGATSLTVTQVPTATTYNGDTTASSGKQATLSATLVDVNGQPLAGKSVTISFGSSTCTATTDATGFASCKVTVVDGSGSYPITASFAGDATYLASSGPSTMTVAGHPTTTIVDNVSGNFLLGTTVTLSGTLTANGLPLAGKTVTLTFGSTSCTTTTNANGLASCAVMVPGSTGPTSTRATFSGDVAYNAASDTKPALVYAYAPGGGNFVVGDLTDAGPVYFWGSQWWKKNSLSHGDPQANDPAAFKGFAAHPGTLQCGVNWSTDPGNSTPPPSAPLPAYMAVIVTDRDHKVPGKVINGDTFAIVIVKTNPGYQGNPGHDGTGTVVATVCTGGADDGSAATTSNGGSDSGSGTVTCSSDKTSKTKCESLLANPSVANGAKVTGGQMISILYADDTKLTGTPTVTIDGQPVSNTVTSTSGVKPTYVDTYGGSASTKVESRISFPIPSGLASGSHTVTVTVQDGDGDYDVYSFTVKI
jgi:hypothetical protein